MARWRGEPAAWLVEEDSASMPNHLPRIEATSFELFQHSGMPIEWSGILVRAL